MDRTTNVTFKFELENLFWYLFESKLTGFDEKVALVFEAYSSDAELSVNENGDLVCLMDAGFKNELTKLVNQISASSFEDQQVSAFQKYYTVYLRG